MDLIEAGKLEVECPLSICRLLQYFGLPFSHIFGISGACLLPGAFFSHASPEVPTWRPPFPPSPCSTQSGPFGLQSECSRSSCRGKQIVLVVEEYTPGEHVPTPTCILWADMSLACLSSAGHILCGSEPAETP